ncbi:MAG: hypothetical protein GX876_09085 [Bacteroidales bacterium]|nr:hypothetical protein [Bacteroidales bacterium]
MKNSKTINVRKLICLSAFLLSSAFLFGQVNFSGTWAFNDSKSDFGGSEFRFAATSLSVQQDAGVLTVESTMPGRDWGEMKTTSKYNLDGSVSENPMFNSSSNSTVAWSADKSTLTITTTMTFDWDGQNMDMKTTQTWKLAEGGKILMIESVRPGMDGEMKTTAAYDKK